MATIALVGKPNVGKSTLFNRIVGTRVSIVENIPGVTRDRIYAKAEWLTREFNLIDTGGLTIKDAPFQKEIAAQVQVAIEEADVIIFVCSAKDGVTPDDRFIAKELKKKKALRVIVCANKSDGKIEDYKVNELLTLGFGNPVKTTAEHGVGVGDLLDAAVKLIPVNNSQTMSGLTLSVIGRPNVGKSTLVNSILGESRVIVSDIAGTTRDAIDTQFQKNGKKYVIIDTAGIRRKGKVYDSIEKYAVLRTEKALSRCEFVIFVVDASVGVTEQDEVVGGLAHKANLPTIIVLNKWDLVLNKNSTTMANMEKEIRSKLQYLSWSPIVFISANENERVHKIFEKLDEIQKNLTKKISTSLLNDLIAKSQIVNTPPRHKGNRLEISYSTQVESRIPTFVLFCNNPNYLHFTYARYLENQIRDTFDLHNVPVTLYFKEKNQKNLIK